MTRGAEETEGEGFLARWSRRKRAVAEAGPPVESSPEALPADATAEATDTAPAEAEPSPPPRAACPIPNLPEIDPASLPRIEDLTAESDFSLFLRPGVPSVLRNAALRRMWSLDPAIRDYIGPVDYQWDFNTPGGLPFGFSNELGGDVAKLLAQAIGRLGEDEAEAAGPPAEEAPAAEAPPMAMAESPPAVTAEAPPGAETDDPSAAVPADPEPRILAAEIPAGPVPPAEAPAPRRRHGGALPG
ncbi:DUF3306 domain-containing protein [Falsiroseomonas oryzae]|uniref:DUF3306 domain-containing protein n=1 Tax=Falsiroseomonas oryzae TaxID=2766473 RepID=UPI0022EB1387|nr:DUF3306 domain-containing protein [Roseomonas sp. MO-31]